ncbi:MULTISPECIES: diiron oxygenase [unclassified Microcoleus]|uniref:diiron oxygenase n=1 Tax=unclassified Microcoleus TaxID=2642155 RepID=UPI0025F8F528|nr:MULTISPECIES: diiron oxygenase [unclassified Microcoleus]
MMTVNKLGASIFQENYKSPLGRWNESSWIRNKPLREGNIEGLPFSPDLVPLADHPAIASDSTHRVTVLAYRLLAHLQFTTLLELSHVNPVCSSLAQGNAPIFLSTLQRNDALRIYCDEGGHALFVELFSTQVEEAFGLDRSVIGRPHFDRIIEKIIAEHQTRLSPHLIQLFFVTISETLVTKVLNNVPHDPQVSPIVRAVIGDHAADEALHSVYFRGLFPVLWQSLASYEQEEMGQLLPQLVWAFLAPDRQLEYSILRRLGFNAKDSEGILEEVYVPSQIAKFVQQAANPTLKMFAAAGVLDDRTIEQVFADYELI